MQKNKGFTLIELLVVIAVIGILAAIVTVALSSVRKSGANTSVKSNLTNAMSQAEIIHMQLGNYGGFCESGAPIASSDNDNISKILRMLKEGYKNSNSEAWGSTATETQASCLVSEQSFSVAMPLQELDGGNSYWCIDSSGYNGSTNEVPDANGCVDVQATPTTPNN